MISNFESNVEYLGSKMTFQIYNEFSSKSAYDFHGIFWYKNMLFVFHSNSKEAPGTAGWGLNLLPVLGSWESTGIALKNEGSSLPKKGKIIFISPDFNFY